MIYIASPYSHPDEKIREQNFKTVTKIVADMVALGDVAISPITYGHVLLDYAEMPSDWDFWTNFCLDILKNCDKIIVCKMEGWDKSKGIAAEIEYAKLINIPIEYIEINC